MAKPYEQSIGDIIDALVKARRKKSRLNEEEKTYIAQQVERIQIGFYLTEMDSTVEQGRPSSNTRKKNLERLNIATQKLLASTPLKAFENSFNNVQQELSDINFNERTKKIHDYRKEAKAANGLFTDTQHKGDRARKNSYSISSLRDQLLDLQKVIETVQRTLDAAPPSKSGPKTDLLVEYLAKAIAPLYEETTGRKPDAHFSIHRGLRTGPFVRVLCTFLEYFGTCRTEKSVGEQVHRLSNKGEFAHKQPK